MAKKGKPKISKIKRNNHTTNKMKKQGKLKLQRHRTKVQKQKQPVKETPEYSSDSESSSNEWADMLDEEEQQYIANRLAKQPNLLSNIPEKEDNKRGSKRKKDKERLPKVKKPRIETNMDDNIGSSDDSDSEVEEKYEKDLAQQPVKKTRSLLPIKTKDGLVERTEECDDSDTESAEENQDQAGIDESDKEADESGSEHDSDDETMEKSEDNEKEITTVELLAARRDRLRHEKLRIGALCSSLLESPEKKLKNLYPILYLMDEHLKDGTPNLVSVRKLASLSAAEVFKDILPEYKLRHQDYSDVKLKKDTLALYKYEKELLEFYKRYLQRLEKAAGVLRPKKGDRRKADDPRISLALLSIKCMCSLLVARPNFNYATNIAQSVIPFLDTTPEARNTVTEACTAVFKEDRKGEITLAIVRLINQLAKRRGSKLNPAALDCLLQLNIQDVELDEEHELKMKKKLEQKKKKRIINLSKKEKKRAKKLKEVERELLETEAKESETARRKQLTEVTKTVFHIYFRLLKSSPSTGLLIAALNGIAKFTHVINLEYYSDLVSILSGLVISSVARSTRLVVVSTVLAVLAKAGDAINVDPAVFHKQLYQDMIEVHAGSPRSESASVFLCVSAVCDRVRRVSCGVLRALAKRLMTGATQLEHHAALAALTAVWTLMQHNKHVSSLFSSEGAGSGSFLPLSPSPEHCGSHAALGYEGPALTSHYHPLVRAAAAALLHGGGWPQELHSLSPMRIFDQYDCSQMCFKPAIPPPTPRNPARIKTAPTWARHDLKNYCETIEDNIDMNIDNFIER
ncbi:unnamed protein product [Danaus chrysippus]|uniref:NOC3-like protein n=1 Tax=Danaus chrysippus TaxID=151541 RepID=A0A8J2QUD0_9NEOP|nr:unnamed protein product [Danaus chrysippus]